MAVGARLSVHHGLTVHGDLTAVGLKQTQHGFHGGGLTRAVLADKSEDTSLGHRQAQAPQDLLIAEPLLQIRDAQHIHHASSLPRMKYRIGPTKFINTMVMTSHRARLPRL